MALYSFSVRNKETGEYTRDTVNHELAFLDYFAAQFNNQEELMRFLGVDPEKYDDIVIEYQHDHETKRLPIFFDAGELERLTDKMVDIIDFEQYDSVYEAIALAYNSPTFMRVSPTVPETNDFNKILIRLQIEDVPERALVSDMLYIKAYEHIKNGRTRLLREYMMSSYTAVRKAYMVERNLSYIFGDRRVKPGSPHTKKELQREFRYKTMSIYEILQDLNLTEYEDILVTRVLNNNDESAYEELKASSMERLKYLAPVMSYLDRKRRQR